MLLSYANIRLALSKKKILANTKERLLCMTILPELGIFGKPDSVDCRNGKVPIIVETKTTQRFPGRPWPDNRLQVGLYSMGLERLGFNPSYAIIDYVIRGNLKKREHHKVHLNDRLREKAVSTTKKVIDLLLEKEEPIPTKNPRKCVPCVFCKSCTWKP